MERKTNQRTAIKDAFHKEGRPLAPAEVLDAAKADAPGLGIATVYRALKSLVDDGSLIPVELPGEPMRYEVAGLDHHHHFHCTSCGKVFDVQGCAKAVSSLLPAGYTLERHEIILYGKCEECAASHHKPSITTPAPQDSGGA